LRSNWRGLGDHSVRPTQERDEAEARVHHSRRGQRLRSLHTDAGHSHRSRRLSDATRRLCRSSHSQTRKRADEHSQTTNPNHRRDHQRSVQVESEERHVRLLRTKLRLREHHEAPWLQARGGHGRAQQPTHGNRMDGPEQRPRLQGRCRGHQSLLPEPAATARPRQAGEDDRTDSANGSRSTSKAMSLLDPIVPYLGPLGPALAASGTIIVALTLFGLFCFGLYKVKSSIFETSKGWVGATIVLSLITVLFRGMSYLCSCQWYYDTSGNPTLLIPLTY